jgi:hypothetical protein
MDRANKLVCPHCGAPLKSVRGIRVGRQITCPKCATAFTVRPEDVGQAGEVDGERLALVVCGVVLYLLGGAALAGYCFWLNARKPEPPAAGSVARANDDDGDAEPPPTIPPPPAPSVDAAEERKIDDAIVQGVWYLREHQLPTGTWGDNLPANGSAVAVGFAALPGLALLECGVPASDPLMERTAGLVRQKAPAQSAAYDTYQRALALLFLDRLAEAKAEGAPQLRLAVRPVAGASPPAEDNDEALIQYLALCLVAGQRRDDGGWGYMCPSLDRKKVPELLRLLAEEKESLDPWRKAAASTSFDPGRSDNSNTQFAVLALWVARRHGVSIDKTIALVKKRFIDMQLPAGPDPTGHNLDLDGAWPYTPHDGVTSNPWPSMTCSGLLGLAVAHGLDANGAKGTNPLDDLPIRRGLAMLGREIDRPGDKRSPDLYFLWSLERVGVLFGLPKIADKDWYAWGAKALLAKQARDGSWAGSSYFGSNSIVDTSFALLFLKQANLAKDLTAKLQLLAEQK